MHAQKSFDTLKNWVQELRQFGPEGIVIAVIGNKLDLAEQREVTRDDAIAYCESIGALYVETSAKDGTHVARAFADLSARARPPPPL